MEIKEKKNKKNIIIAIIIIALLIVIGILSYFLFFGDKITINTDGGKIVQKIEIKNDEIVTLPVIEKEGYKVVSYVNENKKIVKKGSKVTKQTKITPVYVKNDAETVKVTYMDGDIIINELILEKNSELILLEDQVKDGYTFGGWLLENGVALIGTPIVDRDLVLKVNWINNSKEYVTIFVMTADTEETIGSYKLEKGSKIILPSTPTKEGYAFENWLYIETATVISENMIVNKNMSIKPIWAKYECPKDCKVNSDGKTCSKISTANKETKTVCPDGAFLYYGKCITMKGAVSANIRQCDGDMSGREAYYNNYCVKVVSKVTKKVCPSGYKEDGDTCKKETIVNCTKVE